MEGRSVEVFWECECGQRLLSPIISGTGKAMDIIFGRYIQRVHPNKSPLKIGKSSGGLSQGVPEFFTAPVYRAHHMVIFAIAQLSCVY